MEKPRAKIIQLTSEVLARIIGLPPEASIVSVTMKHNTIPPRIEIVVHGVGSVTVGGEILFGPLGETWEENVDV